jgi:alpha-tubulin suppressor-like RCC1 family protein
MALLKIANNRYFACPATSSVQFLVINTRGRRETISDLARHGLLVVIVALARTPFRQALSRRAAVSEGHKMTRTDLRPSAIRAGWRVTGRSAVAGAAAALAAAAVLAAAGAPAAAQAGSRARVAAGAAQAWGDNKDGQLGDGTVQGRHKPVGVKLPVGVTVTAVATGGKHSLAITSTGKVLAWGNNFYGQLGDGTRKDRHAPVAVALPKGTTVIAVAAGGTSSLAVTAAGKVLAWGDNHYGQLGNASTVNSDVPVRARLPMGARVVAVRASYNYSMALTAGGQVLTWGYNGSGQLGTGFHTASEVPVRVRLPRRTRVAAIATGGYDGLVLTKTGRVLAWGDNKFGQLGNGNYRSSELPVAVKVPPGVRIVALGGGSQHSLALTSAGRLLAWGYNAFGQLGTGVTHGSNVPVRVRLPAGVRITQMSAGGGFSVALTSAGRVLAWGHNDFGQLGDGGTASARRPVSVRLPAGIVATALAAGPTTRHCLVIVHS